MLGATPGRPSPPPGPSTTRSGSRSPCCRPTPDDPLPGRRDGRARRRPHRLPVPRSRRPRSASCSTSAPRTSASSARRRRSRVPRASSSRRCPPTGVAVLNADDPLVLGDGGAHRRAGAHVRRGRRRRRWRDRRRPRRPGPAAFALRARRRAAPRRGSRQSGEHQVRTRCGRRVALALGVALGDGRRARWAPARSASPLADGGARARRRGDRGQRRLQRQPRLDARRARGAGRDRAAAGRRTVGRARRDARAR